jgi:hypothetical protein
VCSYAPENNYSTPAKPSSHSMHSTRNLIGFF